MSEVRTNVKKGLTYAVCFWIVYKLLNSIWYIGSSTQDDQAKTSQDAYSAQLKRSSEMMSESERQIKRMDALMTKQEENARRFDALITQMEKTTQRK